MRNQRNILAGVLAVMMIPTAWFIFRTLSPTDKASSPILATAIAEVDADWPIFRGNSQFHGVAPGALPDELELKWTFKTNGAVRSSAVIAENRVYIGSDDGLIYAINTLTGEKHWSFATEGPVEAPPVIIDGLVVVGSHDGYLYALDAKTGERRWRYETQDKITGSANVYHDADGETLLIVGSYDAMLHGVRASDGKGLWTYETDNYINGAPALFDHRAIVGGCDARLHIVDVATGHAKPPIDLGSEIAATAAVIDGFAYVGTYGNEFVCVDLTKNKIDWTFYDRNFPVFSSAALTQNLVIFGTRGGRLIALNRQSGEPVWRYRTRSKVDSSPVICGDKVIVGADDGRLHMVRLADGQGVWTYDLGQPIISSPAAARGWVVVGCDDGRVYAFGAKE